MKTTYTILRVVGAIGAAWLLYSIISGNLQLLEQTKDTPEPAQVFQYFYLNLFIPSGLIALLLILPYRKMKKVVVYGCATLLLIAGAFLLFALYGQYFLAPRFVAEVVPPVVWISLLASVVFLATQVATIAISHKVEQGAAANP